MLIPTLSGISLVGSGAFNPAIAHPSWFAEKGLIDDKLVAFVLEGGAKEELVVTSRLSSFVADWLAVQVTPQQVVFSTVEEGREREVRDLVRSFFELLPETPVNALGINADAHFKAASAAQWHAFGDRFLPKPFWEPLFAGEDWQAREGGLHVGLRTMTVEASRGSAVLGGYLRVEVAPSARVQPYGIYVGLNAHFQLTRSDRRGTASLAADVLVSEWERTRSFEAALIERISGEL